jgi:hypothetical protein
MLNLSLCPAFTALAGLIEEPVDTILHSGGLEAHITANNTLSLAAASSLGTLAFDGSVTEELYRNHVLAHSLCRNIVSIHFVFKLCLGSATPAGAHETTTVYMLTATVVDNPIFLVERTPPGNPSKCSKARHPLENIRVGLK